MKLPAATASPRTWGGFARYVERGLRRTGRAELAALIGAARLDLVTRSRAAEDLEDPMTDALSDRDDVDRSLDELTQQARLDLAARSVDATRAKPYLDIFGQGVEHYTKAPLGEQEKRYLLLADRLDSHLPEGDPVRSRASEVRALVEHFRVASQALEASRRAITLASDARDASRGALAAELERTWGHLVTLVGRKGADRLYPRPRPKKG